MSDETRPIRSNHPKKRKRMGRRKVIAKPFCGNVDNVVNG